MSTRRLLQLAAGVMALAIAAWAASRGLERVMRPRPEPASTTVSTPAQETAHITATLFFGSQDGLALVPIRQEVPLADGVIAQGREILSAQLQPGPAPYATLIPPGTTLRAFYMTERGDAFVDLSREVSTAHPGGSHTELLTIYAIVNAVTTNLPAVQRVQLLVDGHEVDTIAGHVDVRQPLAPNAALVRDAP